MTSLNRDGKGAVPIGPAARLTLLALSTAQHREKASIELFNLKKKKKKPISLKKSDGGRKVINKIVVNLSATVSNRIVFEIGNAVMCDAEDRS